MLGLMFLGVDPMQVAGLAPGMMAPAEAPLSPAQKAESDKLAKFVRVVLADNEDVWSKLFPPAFGKRYALPNLVLFTGQVQSACGRASASAGPFYCPLDKQVYIDLAFYDELKRRFGAPGDFAQAYVIAHEIGHHVQNQLGISEKVQSMRQRLSDRDYNKLSVRMELQADFLAGVWAHHVARFAGTVDEDDIREAVNAAAAIGDDRIQKQSQGYVVPDAFTHGSSEQRVRWFLYGLKTGDPNLMDRAFEVDTP
jgi:predicted metalloprotease